MQAGRTFRVFVSSTFEDLRAERNKLHEVVFPRLRELCQKHGVRFQAIDLRWGVSEEASLDQQTMNICLGEIARCLETTPRPNFVVLLGQRYGWCPPPSQIPAEEFRQTLRHVPASGDRRFLRQWYRRDKNAVPSEYRLLPREPGGEYETYEAWKPVEARLHEIFAAAAQEMRMDEERRRVYIASATEQEIAAGALRVPEPEGKVFCFFRDIEGATDEEGRFLDGVDRFIDADQNPLSTLKGELREKLKGLPAAVQDYSAEWDQENQQPTPAHLDSLAEEAYRALAGAIEAELEHPTERPPAPEEEVHVEPDDSLDAEGRAHCDFANGLLRFFLGRTDPLRQVGEYLEGEELRALAVVAEGGAGKSALMAKAVERAKMEHGGAQIVYRFIGATPGSSDGRVLLRSLCRELSRRYGADEETPEDYRELVPEFGKRLTLATSNRPLIIFLDALDQLSEAHGARGLTWLPEKLPEHVRLIVSTRRLADAFDSVERRQPQQIELGPMLRRDGEELLDLWLDDAQRTLQPDQREELLDKFERSDGWPLYLKLAFEEARRWTSYDPKEMLEPTIPGIIRKNLLDRLVREERHDGTLVSRALGNLAASRHGLAEDELLDVLSRDSEVYGSFFRGLRHFPSDLVDRAKEYRRSHETARVEADEKPKRDDGEAAAQWLALLRGGEAKQAELETFLLEVLPRPDGPRLPVVLWSRLRFDIERYLTERYLEAGSLLAFYHREFDDVSSEAYLGEGEGCEGHGRLADYFRSRADPGGAGRWEGGYPRGLSELPYHLSWAARPEELRDTLTEFNFLYRKLQALGPQPLIEDYDEAVRAGYGDESLELVQDAVRLSAQVLTEDIAQLPGQLIGRLGGFRTSRVTELVRRASHWDEAPWIRPLAPTLTPAGAPLQRLLTGHKGWVIAVAVTPDGRYAVSGSGDEALKVWDLEKGEELRTLIGERGRYAPNAVVAVAVTADGRCALSATWGDSAVKVWDLERGEVRQTLKARGEVNALAVTEDGRTAVSGSGSLVVWDLERGEVRQTLTGHSDKVQAVAVSPDGRYAVSGSRDKTVKVWDLSRGEELHSLIGHSGWVRAVALTADGRTAVSCSDDGTVKVWNLQRGQEVRTLTGHGKAVLSVAVTPDGRHVVSGSADKTLRVWSLQSGELQQRLMGHSGKVWGVAVTADGRWALSGAEDFTVRVWDLERGQTQPSVTTTHDDIVCAVAVSPDGRLAVSGSDDRTLKVWDVEAGEERCTLTGHEGSVRAVAFAPDGRTAVSGSDDTTLKEWDLVRRQAVKTLTGHTKKVSAVAVAPDGHRIVSGSWDGTLKVWDLGSGEERRTVQCGMVNALALAPDGLHVVLGDTGHTLRVFDLERGQREQFLIGRGGLAQLMAPLVEEGRRRPIEVWTVAVTADGRFAVTGADDKTLKVWDLERGEERQTLAGHGARVWAVALSRDGRYAVSGSEDHTLKVWDLIQARVVATFVAEATVLACDIGPDDRTIVAGDSSGRVHFLRLERAEAATAARPAKSPTPLAPGRPGPLAASAAAEDRRLGSDRPAAAATPLPAADRAKLRETRPRSARWPPPAAREAIRETQVIVCGRCRKPLSESSKVPRLHVFSGLAFAYGLLGIAVWLSFRSAWWLLLAVPLGLFCALGLGNALKLMRGKAVMVRCRECGATIILDSELVRRLRGRSGNVGTRTR